MQFSRSVSARQACAYCQRLARLALAAASACPRKCRTTRLPRNPVPPKTVTKFPFIGRVVFDLAGFPLSASRAEREMRALGHFTFVPNKDVLHIEKKCLLLPQ